MRRTTSCPRRARCCRIRTARFRRTSTRATPTYSYYRKKQWSVGYQFEHKFDPVWTFRQNTRWMHLSLDQRRGVGRRPRSERSDEADAARYAGLFQPNYSRFDIDNQAQARFGTGPLEHTVLLGFEYNRQNSTDSEWLAPVRA